MQELFSHIPDHAVGPSFGPGILQIDDGPDGGGQPADEGDLQDQTDNEMEDPASQEEGHAGKKYSEEEHDGLFWFIRI
jgi:hypothetical protein